MFQIYYHDSIHLDGFSVRDVSKSFKCKRIEFVGGIAYCYRSEYAYMAISQDQIDDIVDLRVPGLMVGVKESFCSGQIEYMMVI